MTTRRSAPRTWGIPLATVALAAALLAGCKGSDRPVERPQATPAAAATNFTKAVTDCDDSAVDFVRGGDDVRDVVRAGIAFRRAAIDFRAKFIAAYGEAAWATFQDDKHSPGEANAQLSIPDAPAVTVQEGSDGPFVDISGTRVRFVRAGQGWLVDGNSVVPAGKDAKAAAVMLRAYAGDVQRLQKAIGRPSIRPDDIDVELGRAMMRSSGLKPVGSPRFDVDRL